LAALLQIGLVNAIVATLLAIAVALIARNVRRPALVHALWIVVLVKLVTPPLFDVPIEVPFAVPSLTAQAKPAALTAPLTRVAAAKRSGRPAGERTHKSRTAANGATASATAATVWERISVGVPAAATSAWSWIALHKVAVIGWTWLAGAMTWFVLQGFTAVKFSHRLALATPAPAALQHQADELARAMGLLYRPPVMIVRDVLSPMLWGIGRNTRLLFPVELLARLDSGARNTLIAHELAHFRRGDHWVRAFELVVTGLFWWHPVVWWARREIEITEEECCDGWVIDQFPASQRSYAEALLETLDFLSERALVLPPAAAGAGHVPFLRRRITAIMRGVAPQKMSRPAWLAVACLAISSLPWHPGLVQAQRRVAVAASPRPTDAKPRTSVTKPAEPTNPSTDLTGFSALLSDQIARITRLQNDVAPEIEAWATARSRDNRFSITRRGRDGVSLHDSLTGQSLDLSEHSILTVAFAPDGKTFATGGADKTVRLWDSITGELRGTFRGHPGSVQAVVFVNDGKELITASRDGSLKRWSVELLDELPSLPSRAVCVNCLAVSNDGRWLAIGTGSWMSPLEGGRVVVWDLATETEEVALETPSPVGAVAFRANDRELITGDYQGYMTFWDVARKQFVGKTRPRFKDAVAAARFSLDTGALADIGHGDIEREPEPELTPAPGRIRLFFNQSARLGTSSDSVATVPDEAAVERIPQFSIDPSGGLRHLELRIGALEREIGTRDGGTTRRSTAPLLTPSPSNQGGYNTTLPGSSAAPR